MAPCMKMVDLDPPADRSMTVDDHATVPGSLCTMLVVDQSRSVDSHCAIMELQAFVTGPLALEPCHPMAKPALRDGKVVSSAVRP